MSKRAHESSRTATAQEHKRPRAVVEERVPGTEPEPEPLPSLPLELLCWVIPRFLDFCDALRLGAACKELSRHWRKNVRKIPDPCLRALIHCNNRDEILMQFTNLRYFGITHGDIMCDDILSRLTTLEGLVVSHPTVGDRGITALVRLNALTVCASTSITGSGIAALSGSLRKLKLIGNAGIMKTTTFSTLANLTSLTLVQTGPHLLDITLCGMCKLTSLSLGVTVNIVSGGLFGLHRLEKLDLQGAVLPSGSLASLTSLRRLSIFAYNGYQHELSALTNMRYLRIRDTGGDMTMASACIAAMTQLKVLDMRSAARIDTRVFGTRRSPGLILYSTIVFRTVDRMMLFVIDRRGNVPLWTYGMIHLHEQRFLQLGIPMNYLGESYWPTPKCLSLSYWTTPNVPPERITCTLTASSEGFYTEPWYESDMGVGA